MAQLKTFEQMFWNPNKVTDEASRIEEEMGDQHLAELVRQLTNPEEDNSPRAKH